MKVMGQLVDLGEIGLAEAAGKRPLRLLVRLTVAGGTAPIRGAESVLEGETLAHTAEVEPAWAGDEMHLLTVETRTGNRLYSHYVLLQQEDAN